MDLTRTELATALGIDPTTVDAWVRQGAPVIERNGKGRPSAYSLPAVVQWRIAHEAEKVLARIERRAKPEDIEALKARRLELENERRELELARAHGKLVPADEIGAAMARLIIGGRGALLGQVPQRVAAEAHNTPDANLRALVAREMRRALEDWSRAGLASVLRDCGGLIDPEAVAGCEKCTRMIEAIEAEAEGGAQDAA